MASLPAIVLLAHGSPDPDWHRAFECMRQALEQVHGRDAALATLGGDHDTGLEQAVERLVAGGAGSVVIVAVFLSSGGKHVKRDIPDKVDALRARLPTLKIVLAAGALGETPEVGLAMAAAAQRVATEAVADDV